MPNDAFYKLDSEKRNKILEAMEEEFGCNSFEKASVNKIVENAGISKGSFWFYFENKEEAIDFIINEYVKKEEEKIIEFLEKNKGDIFQSYIDYFDYILDLPYDENKAKLLPNIFKDLMINDKKVFDKINFHAPIGKVISEKLYNDEKFKTILDLNYFKDTSKENVLSLLKLLNFSLRSNSMDICFDRNNLEKRNSIRENFIRQINILKFGVKK